jgi:hypothetical protein
VKNNPAFLFVRGSQILEKMVNFGSSSHDIPIELLSRGLIGVEIDLFLSLFALALNR